jgi:DNA sulfur modification protein DndD
MIPEFDIFVKKLMSSNVSDDVKRICYLTYKHFSEILPLGTAHGQRSKKIIEITQKEFVATVPVMDKKEGVGENQKPFFKRMVNLEIESFRGFSSRELFDLNASIILIYGPNGTGKSSFFEAIEFALLGYVEEAGARRFLTITDYLKNARTQRFIPPILHAQNEKDETALVSQDSSTYRFCFVEKNRIDDFARMAAKTPMEQERIIGTLFGLDFFNAFVNGFSSDLDSKYIDLLGKKATELELKKTALAIYESMLEAAPKDFEALTTAENQTAIEFNPEMSFNMLS